MRQRQQCGCCKIKWAGACCEIERIEQHVHTYAASLLFSPRSVNESRRRLLLLLLLILCGGCCYFIPFCFVADVNFFCRWIIIVDESWVRIEIQFCFRGTQILDAYAYHFNLCIAISISKWHNKVHYHWHWLKWNIPHVLHSNWIPFFFLRWSMAFNLICTNCKLLFFSRFNWIN